MDVIHLKYPHQLNNKENQQPLSLAIGFFDGVHRGHQAVINKAKQYAEELGIKTAVMTFDPHPSIVLSTRNEPVFYITPLSQKLRLFEKMGVDVVFVVHFTSDFAKLSPSDFVDKFIASLHIKHLTAGFDFTFGARGTGTMDDMKLLSNEKFGVTKVDRQEEEHEKISSTRIRNLLQQGQTEQAALLLGRSFETFGIVVHGDKRGRTIGFPTANVQAMDGVIIPAVGVYAVRLQVQNEWYNGICNVGYKPTFNNPDDKKLTIEVHILNFEKNIYGEEVIVSWYKRLRSEQKFSGIEALKEQIEKDKQQAIEYFQMMEQ